MTNQHYIFLPLLAQVLLTILVWHWMYKTRITEIIKKKINLQTASSAVDAAKAFKHVSGPSDNFTNLLEAPVLFYVATITIFVTSLGSELYLILCSVYVLLRYIHSAIHISYNYVIHRFIVYALSTIILWTIWIFIGIDLINHRL